MKSSLEKEQRIHPFFKTLSLKLIPKFIFKFLDPFVYTIEKELLKLSKQFDREGVLILDGGCGENKNKNLFKKAKLIGLDNKIGDTSWDYSKIDLCGDLNYLPFKDNSFDLIISIVTLEHVKDPLNVLKEIKRTLKKGGLLFLIVPFMWEYHQIPNDYFRFTKSGIMNLLEKTNFKEIEITPIGGFFWLFSRRLFNFLTFFQKHFLWVLFFLFVPFVFINSFFLFYLDKFDNKKNFSLGYRIKAKK